MYDIITIGSATRDVYLESNELQVIKDKKFKTGRGLCMPEGSKVNVENIFFTTGGSAVNTAVTFAQQGFSTATLCKVGEDFGGEVIEQRLHDTGVSTELITIDEEHQTAYSVVVHSPSGERSIFVYRGATSHLNLKNIDFSFLKNTKWIYITHLGQESAQIFEPLLKEANKNSVKIVLNPGETQLKMGKNLVPFLNYADILFVNQEEASYLTGVSFDKEEKLFEKLDKWVKGIAVMTKGPKGIIASDGKYRWKAGIVKEPRFVDRTGAGDAFGSGFTSAIMRGGTVEDAIQLGSTNSASVLGEWGANSGLLTREDAMDKFGLLDIKKSKL
ncbi:MAG: hypothetical protein A3H51_02455 [Candidatus Spechtbacteria bacterium RIFCSPLOWO2_02_FULL_38_8]|uniref:Carbohydrate kinase PfkB domain-containing protein n=1 Tax=Candidatus Spechtbacteria bacterium RIFCSPLOWO2_02_FULL_38_8 TaxID=1802164 RepID=A0A1G2HJF1_9BACT|nr:MAG: hypothetical protein A3H51_02455 [Candidatus Spechtbacteria bacterium RIFCSPLOWO2_02_FULL_38_8]